MKILAILHDDEKQKPVEILEDMKDENQVEIIRLNENENNYDELVEKIDHCDKVISW